MERSVILFIVVLLFAAPAAVFAEGKRPMTIDDLFRFKRISDPQISPDGKFVVYVVGSVDLDANSTSSTLWLASTNKSETRQLTNTPKKDRHPRWSPDGKHILFESNRSGENQLWIIDLNGGEARQLTTISTEASNGIWSRDGKHIAFVSAVYPEYSDKPFKESDSLNKKRKEEIENSPVKAKVFKRLFYRHWDSYVEDKRQHLFVMSADGGEPKDVTPSDRDAYPTSNTFSTGDNFTFSPDGKYLVFTAAPAKDEAWSTNYEICRVPITGRSKEWETLSKDNEAADSGPVFSPDLAKLAYRAQKRAGFEADRWELIVVETDSSGAWQSKPRSLTQGFDRSVEEFCWEGSDYLCLIADDEGSRPIFTAWLNTKDKNSVGKLSPYGTYGALSAINDGHGFTCTYAALNHPNKLLITVSETAAPLIKKMNGVQDFKEKGSFHVIDTKGSIHVIDFNDTLLAELDLPRPESVKVKVEGGEMQMWILKPPGFDAAKKWPLAYLVHGGPQGAWEDGWSFRWCPQLWAAQGYVVALPNPRGSTGFGQKFVDEISGDWGGKCFDDLMKGVDYLEKLPYIDKERMAAAGASFGGYMMDWFQGNTTRFKTLITHCGVYNFESALTDELWFDEWEHGGPPWGPNRKSYEKHSPHRYAKNFKTPMLIIHNDLDFRVPVSQGHELFTTLQRLRIPSKFINFPDEGHWVLKPKNSEYWHREVFAWLKKYVPPGGR